MSKLRLLEELTAHIGVGQLNPAAHDRLDSLMRAFPDSCRAGGAHVWRAVPIPPESSERLEKGETVQLEVSPHSCWTTEFNVALGMARLRFMQADKRDLIILRDKVPEDARSLDVVKCFRWLEADNSRVFAWDKYARFEAEIIIANDRPSIEIGPGHIAELWRRDDRQFEVMAPRVGEIFYGDGLQEIEEVIGPNDCGCIEVRVDQTIYPLIIDSDIYSPSCLVIGGAPRPYETAVSPEL